MFEIPDWEQDVKPKNDDLESNKKKRKINDMQSQKLALKSFKKVKIDTPQLVNTSNGRNKKRNKNKNLKTDNEDIEPNEIGRFVRNPSLNKTIQKLSKSNKSEINTNKNEKKHHKQQKSSLPNQVHKSKTFSNHDRVNKSDVKVNPEKQINIKQKDPIATVFQKKVNRKKEIFKNILEKNRSPLKPKDNNLRQRMLDKLKAAQFRYLNEKLYTSSGSEAKDLFQTDPDAFHTYHQGYQQQLKKWPVNPLDVIVKKINKMPKSHLISDMGCGEAALSKRIPHKVRSFDLVSSSPEVEACDMAHTPLLSYSMDVVVYCLALMGTDLTQYLIEANRVLKNGGQLLIAEVESRFDNVDNFINDVQRLGFKLVELDKDSEVFFFMQFKKVNNPPVKNSKLPSLTLKPCLYKRR